MDLRVLAVLFSKGKAPSFVPVNIYHSKKVTRVTVLILTLIWYPYNIPLS